MALIARSDPCGRVWIEDAEHGRFPPNGFYLSFPQHKARRDVAAILAIARKMAAVGELERQRDELLGHLKNMLAAVDQADFGDGDIVLVDFDGIRAAIAEYESE